MMRFPAEPSVQRRSGRWILHSLLALYHNPRSDARGHVRMPEGMRLRTNASQGPASNLLVSAKSVSPVYYFTTIQETVNVSIRDTRRVDPMVSDVAVERITI